ncbi:hypothetical protein C0213_07130 [Latilactobacillus sakei]|nr:hypothetical protein [Latilactobacillus sakei]AUX12200.1 hypothetical protein C0213_07130 [Latilactobacillus sakei]
MNDFKMARRWLDSADAILISASNGLSITEGYNIFAYDQAFKDHFQQFHNQYGFMNILQGLTYQFPTPEERQVFYSAIFDYMVNNYQVSPVFQDLKALIADHAYFIVTSNGDTHFQLSGFNANSIFEVEGNIYNNQNPIPAIKQQQTRFNSFIERYQNKNVVVLELGIGAHNQLIKAPLMQLVAQNSQYKYITLNLPPEINIPTAIGDQSIGLAGSIDKTFKELLKND